MKVTAISGLFSKIAELRQVWANHDKILESKKRGQESLESDSALPQESPQLALHHPKRNAAWFVRAFGRSVVSIRARRRSSWRATVGEGGASEQMIGTTKSSAVDMTESESINGMPEKVAGPTESDPGAIDIEIRARNKRVAWNERVALLLNLARQESPAQAEYLIETAAPEFTEPLNSGGNTL